jgi:hypothetical protein
MKVINKVLISITVFIIIISIFTVIYNTIVKDLKESLHIAVAIQTFTGSGLVDTNQKIRNIATAQLIFSYIFVIIILYDILNAY